MLKPLGLRTTRSGREWSDCRMEAFDVDADALARRAAEELREDSEEEEEDEESEGRLSGDELELSVEAGSAVFSHAASLDPTTTHGGPRPSLKRKFTGPREDDDSGGKACCDDGPKPDGRPSEPREHDRQRVRRRRKRKAARVEEQASSGSKSKPFCAKRTVEAARTHVEVDLDSNTVQEPVSSTGLRLPQRPYAQQAPQESSEASGEEFTKAEMASMGMTEDDWDGSFTWTAKAANWQSCAASPETRQHRTGAAMSPQPGFELMKEMAPKLSPLDDDTPAAGRKKRKKKRNIRRGSHRAERSGLGGAREASASTPFTRIAGFSNSILQNFAPRLHEYYEKTMDALFDWDPRLRRIFPRGTSVFPSATFNFGPQTVTIPHLDLLNLAWGWCFITALGNFDPNRGGHLILWDLKRFIRFPPGATIAIPSALLRHSNISIQQDELRYSFTQFAAGGLFRFVENGFLLNHSAAKQAAKMSEQERMAFIQHRSALLEGLAMYNVHRLY
ncbi:hypothetical protein HMN09_00242900 [Mycena chlorophos]|uniref:Uncharacterized protein n=1 Tax=Mycena chlorophos TaxID=658473 RepID=A0A8H6WIQ2_MYCCL|nr:hypothetical protein HMN09_00242900 [Mycena chlorophos]